MHPKRFLKTLICSAGLLAASLLAACGGGDQGRSPILGLNAATVVSVVVTPATATVAIGATQQFSAMATYTDGSAVDVSAKSVWNSASPAVASINGTGVASAIKAGAVVIGAAFEGKSASATLTVLPATVLSLTLTPASNSLHVAASRQLVAVASYSDGSVVDVSRAATYASATPAAVSISAGGVITGVAVGSSALSASFGGKSALAQATTTAPTVTNIAVRPANASVTVGASQQFIAVATYSDGATEVITATWTSSSNPIATVSNSGVATGQAVGVANIGASAGGQSASGVLTVTAAPVPTPAPTPTFATVNLGSAANFAVLAGSALTSKSGGTTLIAGDVGSPSQTTAPTLAPGFTNYQSGAILNNALADLQVAISDANGRSCDVSFAGDIDIGGLVLPPGVYCYAGSISVTGTVTLSGAGVYIFRTALTLNTTANSAVALIAGASADNVSWVPVGATTLGANSAFKGSILAKSAAITAGDNTTLLNGRLLSAAAVTLSNNQIAK
ncbi:ice-binding family protein [Massilia sp. PWRC2]|uniref:ice-binding family protein n=1 Tax=Massilia sp. PWRC2 TaxID=2804626 RepID=UPI003CF377E5